MIAKGSFMEGSMMKARSKEKQCTFLPVVVPGIGVLEVDWYRAFMVTREFLQLPAVPSFESLSSETSFIILPSGATINSEAPVAISTAQVTDCLRMILGKVLPS